MKKYIMALDAGTTSSRCVIFDQNGAPIASAQQEFKQYYPRQGWVEHDAEEIWSTQLAVAQKALEKLSADASDVACIGLANQRETAVVWDKATGVPIAPAIVWQCRRTAEYCDELAKAGYKDLFREKTGLLLDAYFSATKLKWLLDNTDGAKEKAQNGELLFGTIDTWLIWKLTGGKAHVTDYSNASRTLMYNIHELCWDKEILALLDIPECMLPAVLPSSGEFGVTAASLFGGEIPVTGVAGDQQAALFGQACFEAGEAKNTYGTGGFLLMNTGKTAVGSKNGLLTTIAWGVGGDVYYALEGSVFIAGAVVQWLRDEAHVIKDAKSTYDIAMSVPDNGGVYFVPAFVGLGAPYWDPYARGLICGLTRGSTNAHIVRAALEAMAYQTRDVLSAMQKDAGLDLAGLKVDGGACANDFLLQFQSDILGVNVKRPVNIESTAKGAAYLAGLSAGVWKSVDEIRGSWDMGKEFSLNMPREEAQRLCEGWKQAVRRATC